MTPTAAQPPTPAPCPNTGDECPTCERCGSCITLAFDDSHARQGVLVDLVPIIDRTWTEPRESPLTTLACVECYANWGIAMTEGVL